MQRRVIAYVSGRVFCRRFKVRRRIVGVHDANLHELQVVRIMLIGRNVWSVGLDTGGELQELGSREDCYV